MDFIEQALEFFTRLVLNIHLFNFHWDCGLTGRRISVSAFSVKLNQMDQASNLEVRMCLLKWFV